MRIAALIPCYRTTYFLPAVLKSLSWVDEILVMNSKTPWDSEIGADDKTIEVCAKIAQSNVTVISNDFKDKPEHAQRNIGISLLKDYDYIFLLDSDEIIIMKEQEKIIGYANSHKEYDAFGIGIVSYFGDLRHRALYDEGHTPIVLIRPNVRHTVIRCVECPWTVISGATLHHLKFLQPKEDVFWRKSAKHIDQQRMLLGSIDCEENQDLKKFLSDCGYHNLQTDLTESEIEST